MGKTETYCFSLIILSLSLEISIIYLMSKLLEIFALLNFQKNQNLVDPPF